MEYKNYTIAIGEYGMKEIKPVGKGSVDKALRGKFTHAELAKKAIDDFETSKGKVNGEAESKD